MRLYIASWLAIAGLTAAQPVAAPGALAAAEEGWHNDKMKLTSAWAIEACDHILTTRLSDKPSDPCATFVSEHTQELVDARVAAIGSKNGARELCEEVAQILKVVSDDEAKHIMAEKMPLHKYCGMRFSLDSFANDFFAKLKHFFILDEHHENLHGEL